MVRTTPRAPHAKLSFNKGLKNKLVSWPIHFRTELFDKPWPALELLEEKLEGALALDPVEQLLCGRRDRRGEKGSYLGQHLGLVLKEQPRQGEANSFFRRVQNIPCKHSTDLRTQIFIFGKNGKRCPK